MCMCVCMHVCKFVNGEIFFFAKLIPPLVNWSMPQDFIELCVIQTEATIEASVSRVTRALHAHAHMRICFFIVYSATIGLFYYCLQGFIM